MSTPESPHSVSFRPPLPAPSQSCHCLVPPRRLVGRLLIDCSHLYWPSQSTAISSHAALGLAALSNKSSTPALSRSNAHIERRKGAQTRICPVLASADFFATKFTPASNHALSLTALLRYLINLTHPPPFSLHRHSSSTSPRPPPAAPRALCCCCLRRARQLSHCLQTHPSHPAVHPAVRCTRQRPRRRLRPRTVLAQGHRSVFTTTILTSRVTGLGALSGRTGASAVTATQPASCR